MPIQRKIHVPGAIASTEDVFRFVRNSYDQEFLRALIKVAHDRLNGEIVAVRRQHFGVGDKVMFNSKKAGRTVCGEVTDVMRSRCRVREYVEDKITNWIVPLLILEKDDNAN